MFREGLSEYYEDMYVYSVVSLKCSNKFLNQVKLILSPQNLNLEKNKTNNERINKKEMAFLFGRRL